MQDLAERLDAAVAEHLRLIVERERAAATLASRLDRHRQAIKAHSQAVAESRARTAGMKSRLRGHRTEHAPELIQVAITVALAAWDRASEAPERHGLPTEAALAAYRAVVHEDEEVMVKRLLEALLARRLRCTETVH